MIGYLSAPAAPRRPTRESIFARTLALDPDLKDGSEQFAAAVVLVAGDEVGHNIDRIARLSGVPREDVAQMARRLVDNGVWSAGNTVSHWRDDPGELASFRRDVAVAEGRLCRRMDDCGRLEWAPQGYWRKDFEYSGPKAETSSRAVRYHPHVAVPAHECLFVPEDESESEDELSAAESVPGDSRREPSGAEALRIEPASGVDEGPIWLGGEVSEAAGDDDDEGWKAGLPGALGGAEGGAVWLGWENAVPQPVSD